MFDSWIRETCSKCKSSNWVYNGHSDDDLYQGPDGIICWNCGHQWTFPYWDEEYYYDPEDDEEGEGPPTPNYEVGTNMTEVKRPVPKLQLLIDIRSIKQTEDGFLFSVRNGDKVLHIGDKLCLCEVVWISAYGKEIEFLGEGVTGWVRVKGENPYAIMEEDS